MYFEYIITIIVVLSLIAWERFIVEKYWRLDREKGVKLMKKLADSLSKVDEMNTKLAESGMLAIELAKKCNADTLIVTEIAAEMNSQLQESQDIINLLSDKQVQTSIN